MKEKRLVPKRRFKGYTKEWELNKLKKIADFSKGRGYSKKDIIGYGNQIILYGHLYTNYQSYIKTVNTYALKKENPVISQGYEVIVPSSGETAEDIARASVVVESEVILGGDLNIVKPSSQLDSLFLALSISNDNMQKELIKRVQGISVVHLYNSDIQEITLSYPCIKEQQKIGRFFKHLDDMIELQQRKLEKTKALKSAYLAEMFPAEGERVPKRRFAGFTEEWETKVLSDVAEIEGGGTPSTNNPEYWGGNIDWYSPMEIGGQIYANKSVKTITKLGLDKSSAKVLPPNKTILFTSRAGIGDMAILQRAGATNQGFQSLILKEDIDTYFFYSMGHLIKKSAIKNASGSTFLEVSGKTLGDITILTPSINEQKKIGEFFKQLDDMITNHQRKLEKLKATKQAYLHEMFV